MSVKSDGNIGIGTTSPSQLLEVQGSAQIGNDSVTNAGLYIARKNTNQAKSHYFLSPQESPTYQWIEGGFFTSEMAGISVANNSGKPYYEQYVPAAQVKAFGFINQTTSGSSFTSTAATASIILYQGGNIALTPTLGNVGIGTTSPSSLLHVSGGQVLISHTISTINSSNAALRIDNSGTQSMIYFTFGGVQRGSIRVDSTGNMILNSTSSHFYFNNDFGLNTTLNFVNTNTTFMSVKSDGNIGIGTTAPSATLAVGTQSSGQSGTGNASDNSLIARVGASNSAARVVGLTVANTAAAAVGNDASLSFIVAGNYSATGIISTILRNTSNAASDITFTNYNSALYERMRIQYDGNVGIGTTSPFGLLHVNGGDSYFGSEANVATSIIFRRNAATRGSIGTYNSQLEFSGGSTLGAGHMVITSGGSVGIGTTSPSDKFSVSSGSGASMSITTGQAAGSVASPLDMTLNFRGYADGIKGQIKSRDVSANLVDGVLIFSTANTSNVLTENMRITATGNVGIGTTSPTLATLQVNGNVWANSFTGSFSGSIANINGTTNYVSKFTSANVIGNSQIFDNGTLVGIGATSAYIDSNDKFIVAGGRLAVNASAYSAGSFNRSTAGNIVDFLIGGYGKGTLNSDGTNFSVVAVSGDLILSSNSTEKVRILSGGSVGIGTTSPLQLLHTNGNILLDGVTNGYQQSATRGIGYGSNSGGVSVDGFSGMDIQSVNAPAPYNGNYSQNLRFFTHHYAASTGGTPRMFIQYDGNVGIGTTTPLAKLDVEGNLLIRNAQFEATSSATSGATTLATIATGSYKAVFVDYVALSGSNQRAGTFMGTWNSSTVQYTDYSTVDIGTTSAVTMSVSISGGNALVQATTPASWTVTATYRTI